MGLRRQKCLPLLPSQRKKISPELQCPSASALTPVLQAGAVWPGAGRGRRASGSRRAGAKQGAEQEGARPSLARAV